MSQFIFYFLLFLLSGSLFWRGKVREQGQLTLASYSSSWVHRRDFFFAFWKDGALLEK